MKTQNPTRISIPLSLFLATTSVVPVRVQRARSASISHTSRRTDLKLVAQYLVVCETCARLGLRRCERHYHRVGLIRQPQIPCPH